MHSQSYLKIWIGYTCFENTFWKSPIQSPGIFKISNCTYTFCPSTSNISTHTQSAINILNIIYIACEQILNISDAYSRILNFAWRILWKDFEHHLCILGMYSKIWVVYTLLWIGFDYVHTYPMGIPHFAQQNLWMGSEYSPIQLNVHSKFWKRAIYFAYQFIYLTGCTI